MTRQGAFRTAVAGVLGMTPMSLLAQDLWTQKADMPTARFGLSATVVDGRVYAIGGGVYRGGMVRTVEEYNPATNSWVEKADMPAATCWHSTSAVNGKIYSIGNWTPDAGLDTVVEYDPATDTWTERAEMPTARKFLSTSAVNGKIYAIGGSDNVNMLATVEEYDPTTNTWTTQADMPTPRGGLSTSVVDGIIYAIGGARYEHTQDSTVEAYDPATDTWTTMAPMPSARVFFSTSVVNGKIYAIGGCRGNYALLTSNSVEVYDPATDTWAEADPLPTPRAGVATSTVNGRIYAIGGDSGDPVVFSRPSSTVEELTVAPPELQYTYWLEVAASLAGSHGSQWVTDLVLFNEAETAATVSLVLHGEDGLYTSPASVVAGAQGVFEDVVGSPLGLEGKGLLEVRSSNPLRGAARIYNLATEGTFGQGFALHAAEEGLAAGDTAWLFELRQERDRFRTNIAVANTGDVDAQVRISLLATNGSELHAFTLDLEPGELIQDIEPFARRAGRPDLGWGLARADVITGSGVLVSASVIDSRTNDATTVPMQR
jgi:N-acetylneuraminic acid mutarotase